MKHKISAIVIVASILMVCATTVRGESQGIWETGVEISGITYEEPGIMEDEGIMYGVSVSYTDRADYMFKVEGRYAYGQVDYTSNGTGAIDNIDDYIFELRCLFGYDFRVDDRTVLTPYLGLGYRYLNDDSAGMISSTGHWGYERESNYYYSPVGIEVVYDLENGWHCGLLAEYDIFWKGVQKSHLSDVNPSYSDMENDQDDGYGLRGSITLLRKGDTVDLLIEPYIRYWDIDKSEVKNIVYSGFIIGYGYEPENNSTEIGVKLAIRF
jgi:hypothetical protein